MDILFLSLKKCQLRKQLPLNMLDGSTIVNNLMNSLITLIKFMFIDSAIRGKANKQRIAILSGVFKLPGFL